MNRLQSRPLLAAVLASLTLHCLLFLPWKYGMPLGTGGIHGRLSNSEHVRLDAVLRPAAPTNASLSEAMVRPEDTAQESASTPPSTKVNETATAAGAPIDALYYYASGELDQRPMMKREPEFDEPVNTSLLANGTALLELLIERDGQINAVNVVRTDLLEVHLSPLRKAFSAVEYAPGIKQEQAVRSRVYIEVGYIDGVLSPINAVKPDRRNRAPHEPITLPADWRKRKENPPARGGN